MKPGEIWFIRDPKLGDLREGHYVLIIRQHKASVTFNWITTDAYSQDDFCIDESKYKSDFKATGLNHTSHLKFRQGFLETQRSKVVGGKLLRDIEDWWGEPLR